MTRVRTVLGTLASAAAIAAVAAPAASADVTWLCKPGVAPDVCAEPLTTTVQEPDGSSRVEEPPLATDPGVDCFYVYPTVSGQQGVNADKSREDAVVAIARYQAARFSQKCRVFAPIYRQLTLSSIYTGSVAARAAGRKIAYADVREAWLEYLAKDNGGRGVVLIGHSQGSGMLRQLMREEVDPKPEVRERLVSALLLGGNVTVKKGQRIGGDFQHVPACSSPTELGCVVAFSTFDEDPPDNTRFGKVPATDTSGANLPAGPDYEVLCTNPASLGANERRELTSYLRSEPFPGTIGAALLIMYGGPPPSAPTPWLRPSERYTARCETRNGANVLMAEPIGSARKLNGSPTPDWGLHLADVNLPLGDLVDLVGTQAAAFAARPVRLGARMTCRRGGLQVQLTGADKGRATQMEVRRGARRLGRDRSNPFSVTLRRARVRGARRLTIVARLADGRTATLRRSTGRCGA